MIRGLQSLARRLLPSAIRKPLADRVYGLLTRAMNLKQRLRIRAKTIWFQVTVSRPRLGRALKPLQRLVQKIAQRIGVNYAEGLEEFGRALPRESSPSPGYSGVSMMIGTLGGGGSERQLVLTAQGLRARGMRDLAVAVVYLQDQADRFFLPELTRAGVRVDSFADQDLGEDLPAHADQAMCELPRKLNRLKPYLRALAQHRPRVAHLWLDDVNVKGGLAAVTLGIPRTVLGMRSLPPTNFLLYQPYMRDCYRWLARQPGVAMLNNSQAGARAYEQWLGLAAGSITVLRNGFVFDRARLEACRRQRVSLRQSLGIVSDAPVVGGVMRLAEEKRPFLWLEAAARLTALLPAARFILAGDGPLMGAVRQRTRELGLEGRLHLLGQTKQPLETMATMDLFLLTSRVEGLPNVLVEAQSLGVPAVTTRVGGAPEAINHGVSGWALERDDPRFIAHKLKRLWEDRDWRRRAQAEGLAFVQRRFGLERMIDETWAMYGLGQAEAAAATATSDPHARPAAYCAAPAPAAESKYGRG